MRVVTIGGGHGQAALLAGLLRLDCTVTAVVSVADDGGCSGKLRSELGMAPPGDMRRCLSTLASDRALAACFETRLDEPGLDNRSAGNLVLAEVYRELGSLQAAVDWAADLLGCRGRVLPAAEYPGELVVYDRETGQVRGETEVAEKARTPLIVSVQGPMRANDAAMKAIAAADWILIGPGSFITSILATLGTADLANAFVHSRARCVLMANLAPEGEQLAGFQLHDYARLLRDHIIIHSRGYRLPLSILAHDERGHYRDQLGDRTPLFGSPLAAPGTATHDPLRLAGALAYHFGLAPRQNVSVLSAPDRHSRAHAMFTTVLNRARARLSTL
ncbi:MAG: 2-phospho-L-lactate transferase CofD family protein [Myxococcota bacterium]